MGSQYLVQKLQDRVMNVRIENEDQGTLVLWCLFVGGACAKDELKRDWFEKQIDKLARRLGMRDWRVIKEALQKLWWVEDVHEKQFKSLWEEIAVFEGVGRIAEL